ncbi:hypothetical protein PF008_g3457 [Phytophthora fragariae]|uniref:Uncharacterized protein n=1 Tax=Phytophthora fragariae TaxID=53985 RepID=A0A6G0SEF2_9STRA|nr:hypothetical protein PF008_g3457 [Phytophthora fragariae]
MARRLMSRRGGSASQPQVTPYQQIELDDGWREWENTKQELALLKRQLTEKDALVIQLKTASRRLQETLRKKDKDLQAAFAILRSPQDAKTTKTRKQELIDRLVSECVQRAATAEALAEERRRELDRLRYSSKFLRFQELETEIEECHTEIGRLRAKFETTAGSPTIAGKLKVSSVPLATNGSGSSVKKTKLDPLNLVVDESSGSRISGSVPNNLAATRRSVGQVRVVPLAKVDHREGFVSKTRRRALEAEYYKQVRLAQLEVECELEENLHIRAAREAKKLQAIEHSDRHVNFAVDSARSQQEADDVTLENNEPAMLPSTGYVHVDAVQSDDAREDLPVVQVDGMEQIADQQSDKNNLESADRNSGTNSQTADPASTKEAVALKTEQTELGEKRYDDDSASSQVAKTEEVHSASDRDDGGGIDQNAPVSQEDNEQVLPKQKTYDDDEFDGSDDDANSKSNEAGPAHSAWNLDPNWKNNSQEEELPIKADSHDEVGTERAIWNADPHVAASDTSVDNPAVADGNDKDDEHEAASQQEDSVSTEDNDTSNAWNVDPSPSVPVVTPDPTEEQSGLVGESKIIDDFEERNAWNLDPTPSSEPAPTSELTRSHNDNVEQPVWNLSPYPTPDVVANPELPPGNSDNTEEFHPEFVEDDVVEDTASDDASRIVDQHSPDTTSVAEPATAKESESTAWNLDPDPSPSPTNGNLSINEHAVEPAQNEDSQVPEVTSTGSDGGIDHIAQTESNSHTPGCDEGQTNAWNLDPNGIATEPVGQVDCTAANNNGEDGWKVWNLNPYAGDASEPSNSVTEDPDAQDSAQNPIDDEIVADKESLESSSGRGSPTFADGDGDMAEIPDPTEHTSQPGSSQNSPRASGSSSPTENNTPDYTPPSTGRDSDAAGDEDATW